MGGKTATTTQQVQIPKEVMDRYTSVNQQAQAAAAQPFQAYSRDPSAFVAPLTATQQAGIQNINQAAGMTQPYFNTAAGLTLGGAQGVGPLTQQQIGYYQSPFTQSVVDATRAGLQQLQGQQLAQQQAEAIRAGAFGGDRAGIQRALLQGQQNLATAQAISPLYQQAYQQAAQTAAGQQGVMAQDLQRQLAAGQQLGGLGAAAQQAALQGAQAQLGAGAQQQQTEQAGLSALYNQFLQERGYPFQVAQFLANIAMGTGALSGSTTTTAQPVPFFSDLRNKRNVQVLGRDPDSGNLIIAYDDKDDLEKSEMHGSPMPPKRVGPIAQELEAQHPELVSEVGGHKIVKGLAPESMGGPVIDLPPGEYREHKADGGGLAALYAQFGSPYGPQQGMQEGPYGARAGYLKSGLNPPGRIAFQADTRQVKPISTIMQEAMRGAGNVNAISGMFDPEKSVTGKLFNKGLAAVQGAVQPSSQGNRPTIDQTSLTQGTPEERDPYRLPSAPPRASGGLVGYADGGEVDKDDPMSSYGAQGAGIGIPTEMKQPPKLQTPGAPSSSGAGGLGAGSQLLGAAGAVNTLATAGSTIAEALPALMAFLPSDERMKDNVEQVGELYDGQPVYRYNMKGSPRTQLGLVAQDVERSGHGDAVAGLGGIKMVDYKRATDVAAGLAPRVGAYRGGYQSGGNPSFEEALERTLRYEGGYNPDDVGSPTMMGIRQRSNPDVDLQRVRDDPDYRASIYRERYWNPVVSEGMDPRMATVAFDTSVNLGPARTKELLAQAEGDPIRLLQLRQQHYNNLIAENPEKYGQYERGWNNRVKSLMAYAGDENRAQASNAIERQAGPARGLAGAQRDVGRQEPSGLVAMLPTRIGTRSLTSPKGEPFQSVGEFLTSKQFVLPFLEGLGAMASSPSLFAGPAVLQGLGAGARSYRELEKAEQDLRTAEAGEQQVRAATDLLAQRETPYGNFVLTATGERIPAAAYNKMWEDYRAGRRKDPPPRKVGEMRFDERGQGTFVTGTAGPQQGDLSPKPKVEGPQVSTTEPPAPPKVETIAPGVVFSEEALNAAKKEGEQAVGGGKPAESSIQRSQKLLSTAQEEAEAARRARRDVHELAVLFGKGAKLTGAEVTGAGFEARSKIANVLNTIASFLGKEPEFTAPSIAQQASKITALIEAAKASGFSNAGIEMMQSLARSVPNMSMDKDAYTKLGAEILVAGKMARDRQAFLNAYANVSGNYAVNASSLFDKDHDPAFYRRQTQAIQHLMLKAPDALDQMFKGQIPRDQIEGMLKRTFPKYSDRDISALIGYFEGG